MSQVEVLIDLVRAQSAVLAELRAEVAELREDQQFALRRLLSAEDRRCAGVLLPAAYALLGDSHWTLVELSVAAFSGAVQRAALADLFSEYASATSGLRPLGKLLDRCDGVVSEGLRLTSTGSEREGRLYVVRSVRVSGRRKHAPTLAEGSPNFENLTIGTSDADS